MQLKNTVQVLKLYVWNMILLHKSVNNSIHITSLPHQDVRLYTVLVTRKWVLQGGQRHWSVCSDSCHLLYGKQSRFNKWLITVQWTQLLVTTQQSRYSGFHKVICPVKHAYCLTCLFKSTQFRLQKIEKWLSHICFWKARYCVIILWSVNFHKDIKVRHQSKEVPFCNCILLTQHTTSHKVHKIFYLQISSR